MRIVRIVLAVIVVAAAALWWMTRPAPLPEAAMAGLTGDPARGRDVFHAAGCGACHMAPGAEGEAVLVLKGGLAIDTPFGRFVAPNITPDPAEGIGGWTLAQFASALQRGVSPGGAHYYPILPYAAYERARPQDIADLKAFTDTLPADSTPSQPHDLRFPFSLRATLGVWKLMFTGGDWVVAGPLSPAEERGRYLVEALGHCGECHTPRNALGGLDRSRWLAGAPSPDGKGTIPNITPGGLAWSQAEIVEYLTTGITPDFDTAGGHMALVVENLAQLPPSDREAIAAYLARVPAVEGQPG